MGMPDLFLAVLILLILSISIAIAFVLNNSIIATNTAIFQTTGNQVTASLNIFVDGAVIIYIVLNIAAIAATWFIKTHPVLALAALLFLGIEVMLTNIVVQVFQTFIQSATFQSIGNTNMSIIISLFQYLPVAIMAFGALLMLVQFAKPQGLRGMSASI